MSAATARAAMAEAGAPEQRETREETQIDRVSRWPDRRIACRF